MNAAALRVFVSAKAVFGDAINNVPSQQAVVFINGVEFVSCLPVNRAHATKINEAVTALKGPNE